MVGLQTCTKHPSEMPFCGHPVLLTVLILPGFNHVGGACLEWDREYEKDAGKVCQTSRLFECVSRCICAQMDVYIHADVEAIEATPRELPSGRLPSAKLRKVRPRIVCTLQPVREPQFFSRTLNAHADLTATVMRWWLGDEGEGKP